MHSRIWFTWAQFLGLGALITPRLGILSRKHFDRDSKSLLQTTWLSDWWVRGFRGCAWRSKSVSGCETGSGASSGLRRRSPLEAAVPSKLGAQSVGFEGRGGRQSRSDPQNQASAPAMARHGGCRPINHTGGDVASRHDKDRNGHAQPDGWRPAPALGASAARHPSACWPECNTKPGYARTPGRRPRAAFRSDFTVRIERTQRRTIPRTNLGQESTIRPGQPPFSKAVRLRALPTSPPMLKHASHASPKIHLYPASSKNRSRPNPRNRLPKESAHSKKICGLDATVRSSA